MPDKEDKKDKNEMELEWFPTYPDKILSSVRWMRMTDFQRGWYWQLLLKMTRSKPLGYLRFDDGQLWMLAGAHSRQYWETHAALVLACFKVAEFDGHPWIFNQKLLDVLHEQQDKHEKAVHRGQLGGKRKNSSSSASSSYSSEFEDVWEKNVWERVSKKTAGAAFEKAVSNWQSVNAQPRAAAVHIISQAMEEFKKSDAGKENGMFDGYQPPYPASWLNGQRYLDDRKAWYRTTAEDAGRTAAPSYGGVKPGWLDGPPDCPDCSGTGWKPVGTKVTRCGCRLEKK